MSKIRFAKDTNQAKLLSKHYRQGTLRRIYRGIYTENLQDPLPEIVLKHWIPIVSHIVPNGIISYRTAVELKPVAFDDQFIVFITSTYSKIVNLPGLVVNVVKGDTQSHIEQVLPEIARSNPARMLLENLSSIRSSALKNVKTIGVEGVENFLAKELRLRNEKSLNQMRDEAKQIADELGYRSNYKKLNQIISALLSTHPDGGYLSSDYAKAIAKKEPFDPCRLKIFEALALYIKKCRFLDRPYQYNKATFRNLSFFESYFSNFIEGTEFIIDEAEDIVFKGKEILNRHADSHDILANFALTSDHSEMITTPENQHELLDILQNRHAYLMKERPDKRPGQFKQRPNKVGNSFFVMPEDVTGTLCLGFDIYHSLNDGMEKALFMQFLISEVHPFDDGNGRLSRIMMNAEFVKAALFKIMIPSVHRDNYLNGLRLATRDNNFRYYCKTMDQAQAYTANINWLDYGEAREKIENDDANLHPDEGLPTFNRVLRHLPLSNLAVS